MPRLARQIGTSGFYHVIPRGNGKRILFECDSDRKHFLSLLQRYGQKYELLYLAWCLMDNHVHLLIDASSGNLFKAMHDIDSSYAQYYNTTYEHAGSVFQNRYTSIPIETDNYLLSVMRYIHLNPVKANLTQTPSYPWSSYDDYLRGSAFTSTDMILDMLGGLNEFRTFCATDNPDEYYKIDKSTKATLSDAEASKIAKALLGKDVYNNFNSLPIDTRDSYLKRLLDIGIPARQIVRITGVGRWTVNKLV